MTHRVATSGARALSTTPIRCWQYTYGEALQIAGPAWEKTDKRTRVNNGSQGTALQPLPMALRFIKPSQLPLPDLQKASPKKWKELVQAIPDPNEQSIIENEDGVIEEAGPYIWQVCKYLVPDILQSYGLKGKLEFQPQMTMQGSRPDRIIKYNERAILAFDFKGPNCIVEEELRIGGASTAKEAFEKLNMMAPDEDPHQAQTLLNSRGITMETKSLIKQGVKYQRQIGTGTVVFYDYDYLMIMEPPPDLDAQREQLMDVMLCRETKKSTEGNLEICQDNHVAVLLRCIVETVLKSEAAASMEG